jgi:hypothetical protein
LGADSNDSGAAVQDQQAQWALLHETGHALLEHQSYKGDFELLRLEVAAWERAREVAATISHDFSPDSTPDAGMDVTIDEDHIQDCLDTYRDWLYKRSICPTCTTKCLQQDDFVHYRCFNCHTTWRVSSNRFCRAYRNTKNVSEAATFHL